MNFLLIAILASNIYGLIADADTDYNHVNPDGSYAFGSVILCLCLSDLWIIKKINSGIYLMSCNGLSTIKVFVQK